jgi:D-alanine transaminase
MKTVGYYNGEIGELEDMKVPMLDRVCYFGDGVYDATHGMNGRIYELDYHIDRFFNSAAFIKIKLDITKEALSRLLYELYGKIDDQDAMIYWQVTRGTAMRSHAFPQSVKPNLSVMIWKQSLRNNYKPMKLVTMEDVRYYICNIKTLNLIPSVLGAEKAREADCEETVFHRGDRVTECAHSNVHILKNGVFRTAPPDNLILNGITRQNIIRVCKALGVPVEEKPFTLAELFDADEVIVSAAGTLCSPASEIDGKKVGGRAPELLNKIREACVSDFEKATGAHLPRA